MILLSMLFDKCNIDDLVDGPCSVRVDLADLKNDII